MTAAFVQGTKHICAGCASRFYDLAKSPAICPICQRKVAAVTPKTSTRAKRRTPQPRIDHEGDACAAHATVVVEPKFKSAKRG